MNDTDSNVMNMIWGYGGKLVEADNTTVALHSAGTVAAVHNLSGEPKTAKLDLTDHGAQGVIEILGDHPYEEIKGSTYDLELEPYGYRWFRVDAIRP